MDKNKLNTLESLAEFVIAKAKEIDPDAEGTETDAPVRKKAPVPRTRKPRPRRSGKVAVLIAVLFGSYGLHSFYLGRIGVGLVQLALTVLWGLGDLVLLWAVVDMLTVCRSKSRWAAESLRPQPRDHVVDVT